MDIYNSEWFLALTPEQRYLIQRAVSDAFDAGYSKALDDTSENWDTPLSGSH